jgi:hypothetical protein
MRRRTVTVALLLGAMCPAAVGIVAAPPAFASASQVIVDCQDHGKLDGHYSATELRAALSTLPADIQEYSDCYDVIQSQLLAQLSGRGGSGGSDPGSGGSFLPTPLIVVLVVLVLAGATLGAVAIRRRRESSAP